jgi:dihydroxyacetone kinase
MLGQNSHGSQVGVTMHEWLVRPCSCFALRSYTGDILNFGLAREQYCAANPSKKNTLKFVVVGDDVSVGKKQGEIVGRR